MDLVPLVGYERDDNLVLDTGQRGLPGERGVAEWHTRQVREETCDAGFAKQRGRGSAWFAWFFGIVDLDCTCNVSPVGGEESGDI